MKTLEAFTEEAKTGYENLRKQALGGVKRWVYATMGIYRFDPVPDEAIGWSRGRVVKDEAKARTKYGFDEQERIVYEWSGVPGCYTEYFQNYELGTVFRSVYFCTEFKGQVLPQFQGALQLILDTGGKPARLRRGVGEKASFDQYTWKDGLLVAVETGDGKKVALRTEIEYDTTEQVTKVWHNHGKQRQLYFKRPPREIKLPMLETKIKESLPNEIRETVLRARSKIKSPIYCIALAYDGEGNGVLPPYIGVGLESERQNWLKTLGQEAKYSIWNPAEFTHYEKPYIQMANAKLEKDMELYNQLLEAKSGSDARPIKMLNEVAAALAKLDWSKDFEITDDFVIYCVDFEMRDLGKNLKKTGSASALDQFRARVIL